MKLRIEKAIYGGSGLGRIGDAESGDAGKTVFVPLTLPGELVEARITEDKRSFFNAEAEAILEPSMLRTTPACPYFGSCGGCDYQHAVYPHQLEIKAAVLRETLERAHLPTLPAIHTLCGEHWHYRNRIRLHLAEKPFAVGYQQRRSHQLMRIAKCPIASPLLEKATTTVTEIGATLNLAGFCEEIELFTNSDENSLLASFITRKRNENRQEALATICERLEKNLPQLTGAGIFFADGRRPARLATKWGDGSLRYSTAGFTYRVSLGSFFQVNRFLVEPLVDLVTASRHGRLAWDLYAGVGLFARALTNSFERVIAVESGSESAGDLRHNLEGASHRVIESATLDFLSKQKRSSTPPDLVVVDPPRAGLGAAITSQLIELGPAEIVYVSCDPATLSRDLAALVQYGYDLRTITMVDMFPQTFHLESVSVLIRR